MIKKRLLLPARLRRVPRDGFSWVDRRFVREHAGALSGEAITLYFFLTAVSDKQGLSYWGDPSTAARTKLPAAAIPRARQELVDHGLIAHESPLTQVLSLSQGKDVARCGKGPEVIGDILRALGGSKS